MTDKDTTHAHAMLRALPSVDALLRTETARGARERIGTRRLAHLARTVTEGLRAEIQAPESAKAKPVTGPVNSTGPVNGSGPINGDDSREALLAEAARRLELACALEGQRSLRRVINASGVILHTNLGRAPLSEAARKAVADEAARYCTLEYDAQTGARGRRGAHVEELLSELTGAEDALVVNNCAAAALLILTTLARTGETIVSRGELVEIGGDFRVPDVMAQSGTRMVEVGTTNRTRLQDYESALTDETRLIMRVHPSNYRIVGFTAAPSLHELALLAQDAGLPLYEDAGSGALLDLRAYGLAGEPVIAESIEAGADLVSFSGDKLLGAAQAGLIVGRAELVQQLRRHPLYRALRADKLELAALEATLGAYRRGAALLEVPALRMLSLTQASLEERARGFLQRWQERTTSGSLRCLIIAGESAVGGGSAPTTHPPTALIALEHETLSADALEEKLRLSSPPVIARITGDRVLLDLRTVAQDEEAELLDALLSLTY